MLQLSGTLRNGKSRLAPKSSWRMPLQQLIAACSGAVNPKPVLAQIKEEISPEEKVSNVQNVVRVESTNPKIQAVFNNLKKSSFYSNESRKEKSFMSRIKGSNSVEELLKMVYEGNLKPATAGAIVTQLIRLVNQDKAKLEDFEMDKRFLTLCKLLSNMSTSSIQRQSLSIKKHMDDFRTFYNIGDIRESSKEVANMDGYEMLKIMTSLAQQKKRNTPLLRSLSFYLSQSHDELSVKQLSDLLYSMAVLNFPDEGLLKKITNDLMECINKLEKSPIIGSILTSLGILRYKNEALLDEITTWTINNWKIMRSQDVCSFFMTLATLGYSPANADSLQKELIEELRETDMVKSSDWLNIVWALTVLQLAKNQHIASVLNNDFIQKLTDLQELTIPKKNKLLLINGAAKLLTEDYKGPFLENDSPILVTPIQRSREKQIFVNSVNTAVENIFPPPKYLNHNVDFGMGFLMDAEICIDSTGKRLPLDCDLEASKGTRIAILSLSYNDLSRGTQEPLGYYQLQCRLLEAKGYKILSVPYTEFSIDDKILQRVLYVKNRISNMIKT